MSDEDLPLDGPAEFVFSFRSPFVWIAARQVLPMIDERVEIRWVPFYPLPTFPNFGELVPGKARHNVRHLLRLARVYGLRFGQPSIDEPDWLTPHAAFVAAENAGCGPAFGLAMLDLRWQEGATTGDERTIRRAAESAGADPDEIVAGSRDESLRSTLVESIQSNYDDRGIFGVPMLILPDDSRFWGQDTMEWALRHGFVPSRDRAGERGAEGAA